MAWYDWDVDNDPQTLYTKEEMKFFRNLLYGPLSKKPGAADVLFDFLRDHGFGEGARVEFTAREFHESVVNVDRMYFVDVPKGARGTITQLVYGRNGAPYSSAVIVHLDKPHRSYYRRIEGDLQSDILLHPDEMYDDLVVPI